MWYVRMYEQLGADEYEVKFDAIEEDLKKFEAVALKFSADFIEDSEHRENYNKNVVRVKDEIVKQVQSRRISVKEAAKLCHEMRNRIMAETRKKTSPQGLVVAEFLKKDPRTMSDLVVKYSRSKYGMEFSDLNLKQQRRVYYAIIESSARPDVVMNTLNKRLAIMGKVLIVFTIAYAIYGVLTATDKTKALISEAGALVFGLGGAKAGVDAGKMCRQWAGVCSTVLSIVGGVSGAVLGPMVATQFYGEEENESENYWVD